MNLCETIYTYINLKINLFNKWIVKKKRKKKKEKKMMNSKIKEITDSREDQLPLQISVQGNPYLKLMYIKQYKNFGTLFIPISIQGAKISHFGWVLIVLIFVARINPKIYDFGHFQANSQSYWTQYVSFMKRSG